MKIRYVEKINTLLEKKNVGSKLEIKQPRISRFLASDNETNIDELHIFFLNIFTYFKRVHDNMFGQPPYQIQKSLNG